MKRRLLLRALRAIAAEQGLDYAEREGGRHTVVSIGTRQTVVPRHREINEVTAHAIIKQARGEGR